MARKKGRVPSPPPPTPPRGYSSSDEEESEEEEEAAPATQKAPPNPRPPSTAAADADSSDGGEEEESSDSETDAAAFQVREVARSPGKPSEFDADGEDDGSSSDSPEPVQKKAAARKPKAAESGKKRQAAESIPSGGKAKKAKADPAPLSGKAPPSDPNASSSKGKKRKEKAVPDQSPSKPAVRRWTTEDEIKILEALVSHVKANGTQPGPADLIAALGDSLERKNCSKTEMYEKVRNLRQRHEKAASTGTLPANEDDLRKFNLSEAVWGETAKGEVAAAPVVSQNDDAAAAASKSKKGQTKKEKKGGTAKETTATVNENVAESDKGQATKEKVDGDAKGRLSKKAATADTPVKSKKRGNHKEDLEEDANTGTAKEATNTATQNGGTLVRSKSGKSDKEEKDGDPEILGPKEGTAVTQNDDNRAETHEEKMDIDPNVKNMRRGFDELQNLYPNLTSYVESIQAQHPCGETLKRAFEFIADEKACALESKIKKQRVVEMKTEIRRADTKKELTNIFIGLLD